jgi:hypothetical protein
VLKTDEKLKVVPKCIRHKRPECFHLSVRWKMAMEQGLYKPLVCIGHDTACVL